MFDFLQGNLFVDAPTHPKDFFWILVFIPLLIASRSLLYKINSRLAAPFASTPRRLSSITDSMYFFQHYLFCGLWELCVIIKQDIPFFSPHKDYVDHHHMPLLPELKILYLWQAAYYIFGIFNSANEARKKYTDAINMLIHHIVTAVIVIEVYYYNWTYVGTVTLMIHDFADVIMEFSKCLHYAKLDNIVSFTLPLTMVWWYLGRLIWNPHRWIVSFIAYRGTEETNHYETIWISAVWIILGTLYILNILWGGMILQILIAALDNIYADVRSEDDVDDAQERDEMLADVPIADTN